ncbi:MAG TPA: hypothetical protein VED22_00635 [Nitrososphaerales archaeon]|nr:hypothetical protein [Nitrososphaerales archaeon]
MPKRYVLYLASSNLSEEDLRRFSDLIRERHPASKVIAVKKNPRAVIVKTTNEVVPLLRGAGPGLKVGGIELVSVLTSGAIGNLKRRAAAAAANGEVS